MKWVITTLVLLVVVVVGVAFYRNWIVVEKAPNAKSDSTQINITVDRAKAREDFKEAREQTRDLVKKARDGAENLVQTSTLKGEIMAVDAEHGELKLMADDGQAHVVRVDKDATIQREQAKVGFDTLKVGEKATVKVKEENGVKVAQSITINPNS